jgi:hypothetical protein
MNSHRNTFAILMTLLVFVALWGGIATALTASSSPASSTALPPEQATAITQALPGQGSIVGGLLLGSSTATVLPSLATTTAAATTTIGIGVLSEHNKVDITGSCVVTQSSNAKQCNIYITYTTPTGDPVLGIPVTIRTMNAEGSFVNFDGPLFIKEGPGKLVQYSGLLPNTYAVDVATYIGPATATSTLFVVTTPDGLRAQSTFASSTATR